MGLSLARPCGKDKDAILACAKEFLDDQLRAARTFKVESKRADKTFPMTSIQLTQYVGGELHEAYGNLEVDVHHPELTVYIESGTTPPMSTPTRSPARAACLWASVAGRCPCSPAASTPLWPPG